MKRKTQINHRGGTVEVVEKELTPEQIEMLGLNKPKEVSQIDALSALVVELEYRLTLFELGVNE